MNWGSLDNYKPYWLVLGTAVLVHYSKYVRYSLPGVEDKSFTCTCTNLVTYSVAHYTLLSSLGVVKERERERDESLACSYLAQCLAIEV